MSDPAPELPAPTRTRSWTGALALLVALVALVAALAPWTGFLDIPGMTPAHSEDLAQLQRRIAAFDARLARERVEIDRLASSVGTEAQGEDSLGGRVGRLEERLNQVPGTARLRSTWMLQQAEYFLRIATAQENLAGDSESALTALAIADEHLREAGDPRLGNVRKLIARETATLRALPRVDVEGIALRLGALAESLPNLPRRQSALTEFRPQAAAPDAGLTGTARAVQAVRNALATIVSVRRNDEPPATLLTEEATSLLLGSLGLELQMARLALLRGDGALYRHSLANVRGDVATYFDPGSSGVAAALATLDELAAVDLPESRPDVSASLAALLKFREAEAGP